MSAVASGRQGARGGPSARVHTKGGRDQLALRRRNRVFTAGEIAALVDDLARNTEAVCRHYLSNGRRQGGYWCVGDLDNNPGRSLYVRLKASSKGAAGKFHDAATDEHGDLLDIIRETQGLRSFLEVVAEARRFLGLPNNMNEGRQTRSRSGRPAVASHPRGDASPTSSTELSRTSEAARCLFASSQPITSTLAELYLQRRGIMHLAGTEALRFQPRCFYRIDADDDPKGEPDWPDNAGDVATVLASPNTVRHRFLPALITAVTDEGGMITGVQRTYLDAEALNAVAPLGPLLGKASVPSPRRALGDLLGHGVRLGHPGSAPVQTQVMAVGEGVETMLSLRMALPGMPVIAALSAGNLAAFLFPHGLRRLYIAEDADPAGRAASVRLMARTDAAGIEAIVLTPVMDDFNGDIRRFGASSLRHQLHPQLAPEDVSRFLNSAG